MADDLVKEVEDARREPSQQRYSSAEFWNETCKEKDADRELCNLEAFKMNSLCLIICSSVWSETSLLYSPLDEKQKMLVCRRTQASVIYDQPDKTVHSVRLFLRSIFSHYIFGKFGLILSACFLKHTE